MNGSVTEQVVRNLSCVVLTPKVNFAINSESELFLWFGKKKKKKKSFADTSRFVVENSSSEFYS